MPAARHAASCASVQSVGLASIVISSAAPAPAPKRRRMWSIASAMQSGRHSEGVPPPR
jgi:hypothetical protein